MKSFLVVVFLLLFFGCVAEGQTFSCGSGSTEWEAGLTYSNGVEPGDASTCPTDHTCYYVDCDAVADGSGTYASPYWGFETVLGYVDGGSFISGDVSTSSDTAVIIYVKGTCDYGTSSEDATGPFKQAVHWRAVGDKDDPIVIKSYPGVAQAVFDGEGTGDFGMYFKNNGGADGAWRIENIRVTDYLEYGILIGDYCDYIDIHSVTVDNIKGDGGCGTCSPITVYQKSSTRAQTGLIRNSYFYNNDINAVGGIDNRKTITHHNDNSTHADSILTVQNVVIDGGAYCFGDKWFGGHFVIKDSICSNATGMVRFRSPNGEVDNVIFDSINREDPTSSGTYGFNISAENSTEANVSIHDCTFYDIGSSNGTLFSSATAPNDDFVIDFYNNIVVDTTYTGRPVYLAAWSSESIDPDELTFSNNMYNLSSSTQNGFAWLMGSGKSLTEWNTFVGDTTSIVDDPELSDPANGDFDSDLEIGACVLSAEPAAATTGRTVIGDQLNPLSPSVGLGM